MQILDKDDLENQADAIVASLQAYLDAGKKVFLTSSFQTQSLPLLHMVSRMDRPIPVYYTNTGFLFPDTIRFTEDLAGQLNLNVIALKSEVTKLWQTDREGRFLYTSDQDHCCYLNKVQPLEPVMIEHDIWVNGIRADQSETRARMAIEVWAPHGCTRELIAETDERGGRWFGMNKIECGLHMDLAEQAL